jgi:hypothetical protein
VEKQRIEEIGISIAQPEEKEEGNEPEEEQEIKK